MREASEIIDKLCFFSEIKKQKKRHIMKYYSFLKNKNIFYPHKKYIEEKICELEEELVIFYSSMKQLFWVLGEEPHKKEYAKKI